RAAPMNSLLQVFGTFGQILQKHLFPALQEELGPLSERMKEFVRALALLEMDGFVAVRHGRGRPAHDRASVARAFLAKAVFGFPTTRALLDRWPMMGCYGACADGRGGLKFQTKRWCRDASTSSPPVSFRRRYMPH